MTRRKAIKAFYRWLHGGNLSSVRNCTMHGHSLYPYRTGRKRDDRPADGQREPDVRTGADYRYDKPMQPAKAIRATCLDCAETTADVRDCTHTDCPLWPYRMGRGKIAPDSASPEQNRQQAAVSIRRKMSNTENEQIGLDFDAVENKEGTGHE